MSATPNRISAALAGVFSGLTWPLIWPLVRGTEASATLWLVLATILLVALPAHAFVLGFQRPQSAGPPTLDVALLGRIGSWLAGGVATALLVALFRGWA